MTREAFMIDGRVLRIELPEEVQDALASWIAEHRDELDEILLPFGFDTHDVERPSFTRFVSRDEVIQ